MKIDPNDYIVVDKQKLKGIVRGVSANRDMAKKLLAELTVEMTTIPEMQQQMIADTKRWFPKYKDSLDINMLVHGITGEAGECADVMKKWLRGSLPAEDAIALIAVESIDVFIYLALLWYLLDIDPADAYSKKRAFNERRFGGSSNHQPTQDAGTE